MVCRQRLIKFLEENDDTFLKKLLSNDSDMFSSEFLTFFLNFIHSAAINLFDLKKILSAPPSKLEPAGKESADGHNLNQSNSIKENGRALKSCNHFTEGEKFTSNASSRFISHKNKQNLQEKDIKICKEKQQWHPVKKPCNNNQTTGLRGSNSAHHKLNQKRLNSETIKQKLCSHKPFDLNNSCDFPLLTADSSAGTSTVYPTRKPLPNTDNCEKSKSRRIKPTLIKTEEVSSTKFEEVFEGEPTLTKENCIKYKTGLNQDRDKLLESRIFSPEKDAPVAGLQVTTALKERILFETKFNNSSFIDGGRTSNVESKVLPRSNFKELKCLADLYAFYIMKKYVSSIMEELHLIMVLLFMEDDKNDVTTQDDANDLLGSLLCSVANAKQFSALTLENLCSNGFLAVFCDETLALIASQIKGNSQMGLLTEEISKEINQRSKFGHTGNKNHLDKSLYVAVPFKIGVDDRSNFADDKAFHSFRKQRDMFYSLIREGKEKRFTTENIPKDAVGKLRWLVSQINLFSTRDAFIRLFIDHLFCVRTTDERLLSRQRSNNYPLASFLKDDPEKLRRLENRVTKPSQVKIHSPQGWMQEEFQFFRDFITLSDSYVLNVGLCDAFQARILQIESQNSQIDDFNNNDTNSVVERIDQAIFHLRVCGNFYGFLVFLPRKDSKKPTELSHVEYSAGKFLHSCLESALENGHLLLTVPWLVQFLSFINPSCVASPLYGDIFSKLCGIYRWKGSNCGEFHLFLGVVIGSLFEQDFFESSTLYDYIKSPLSISYKPCNNFADASSSKLITHKLLCEMHWRLDAIRSFLKFTSSSLIKRVLPKKIKPSSEILPVPQNKGLQANLEACFFRNQPTSLKRTVTFVSERCHSNAVKHLCSNVLTTFCETHPAILRHLPEDKTAKAKTTLFRDIATSIYSEAMTHLKKEGELSNAENVKQCMSVLVSSTLQQPILLLATDIAESQSLNSINEWLDERLLDHLTAKIKQCFVKSSGQQQVQQSSGDQIPVSTLIHNFREKIIEVQNETDEENVKRTIEGQLLQVCKLLSSSKTGDFTKLLPNNVLSVLSYLVCESLAILSTEDQAPTAEHLDVISTDVTNKDILKRLMETFS